MKQNFDWLKTTFIAHRGLHEADLSVPENSMPAFTKARDLGYSIELDVNILKDDTLVVFHDKDLTRMCRASVDLESLSLNELKQYRLHETSETVPTLKAVLDEIDGAVPLLIELKSHRHIKKMVPIFDELMKTYQGKWAVFSFDPYVAKWFNKHHPDVVYGIISSYYHELKIPKIITWYLRSLYSVRNVDVDFISYHIKDLPNKYLNKYKQKGTTIISYTANSQADLDYVKSHYDNVVFQYFIPK